MKTLNAMDEQQKCEILEYTRFHALSSNYLDHRYDKIDLQVLPSSDNVTLDFSDPPGAPILSLPQDFSEIEKLDLDEHGRSLLLWIYCCQAPSSGDYLDELKPSHRQDLRLGPPLLRTDHELDIRSLARRKDQSWNISCYSPRGVDEEKDEGFTWPTCSARLPEKYDCEVDSEKLDVSRDALLLLKSALMKEQIVRNGEVCDREFEFSQNYVLTPIAPPLFPATPSATTPQSSPLFGPLDAFSDHTSPTAAEALHADTAILQTDTWVEFRDSSVVQDKRDDNITWSDFLMEEHVNDYADHGTFSFSPSQSLAAHLKVEVPLTPPTSDKVLPPPSFGNLPQDVSTFAPEDENMHIDSEDDLDALFQDIIGPIAKAAESRIQHEQLIEVDSTLRVNVPLLDCSFLEPPWKTVPSKLQTELDLHELMLPISDMGMNHWSGTIMIERVLHWLPFPDALGHVAEEETMQDNKALARLTDSSSFAAAVNDDSLTWKPDGLRVLDDNDDEEELIPALYYSEGELDSLIKKRKLNIPHLEYPSARAPQVTPAVSNSCNSHHLKNVGRTGKAQNVMNEASMPAPVISVSSAMSFEDIFSASNRLCHFMDLQEPNPKRVKLKEQVRHAPPSTLGAVPKPQSRQGLHSNSPTHPQTESKVLTPAPGKIPATKPQTCIFSSALMTRRTLLKEIKYLAPNLLVIERNFEPPPRPAPSSTHPKVDEEDEDPLQYDADITISPGTGIMLTSLQKIKQRALPGGHNQTQHPNLRHRLSRTSQRYERLIVLVSGNDAALLNDANSDGAIIDERDCQALLDFIISAKTTDDGISVSFVPAGEAAMARWIAGILSVVAVEATSCTLLEEETLWEVFLRRAGFNAFAAQTILSELKPPSPPELGGHGVDLSSSSSSSEAAVVEAQEAAFGLPAFIALSAVERRKRFAGLLGGTKVLGRVGEVLDADWRVV